MHAEVIVYVCGCKRRWLEIDGGTAYDLGFIEKCGKPNHGQTGYQAGFMPPRERTEPANLAEYLKEVYG